MQAFRFWDESTTSTRFSQNYIYRACAWTSVILAKKHDCRHHSTTSFSENVMATETSYKVWEVLSFCGCEMASAPSVKITAWIFKWKRSAMKLSRVSIYLIKTQLNFTSNFVDQNNPNSKILVQEWVDLYQKFWRHSKNSQSRVLDTLLLVFKQY